MIELGLGLGAKPAGGSDIPANALYADDGTTPLYADDGTTILTED